MFGISIEKNFQKNLSINNTNNHDELMLSKYEATMFGKYDFY